MRRGRSENAPTGEQQLEQLIALNAAYEPRIRTVVIAHDAARRSDPDLEAAWQDRMAKRRGICARVVSRLERDGTLSPGLEPGDAVDILWALLGSRVHEDLVVARGWSRKRYERQLRAILRSALLEAS